MGTGCISSGGTIGFGSGCLFRGVAADLITGPGGGVVFAVVLTDDSGLRVGRAEPGVFVTVIRVAAAAARDG